MIGIPGHHQTQNQEGDQTHIKNGHDNEQIFYCFHIFAPLAGIMVGFSWLRRLLHVGNLSKQEYPGYWIHMIPVTCNKIYTNCLWQRIHPCSVFYGRNVSTMSLPNAAGGSFKVIAFTRVSNFRDCIKITQTYSKYFPSVNLVFCHQCVCSRLVPINFPYIHNWYRGNKLFCCLMGLLPDAQNCGCACAGNAGTFSPSPHVSDPDMHHGTCVTHVPWCMPESLTSGFLLNRRRGETFPAFSAHAQPAILRIW